MDDLGGRDGNPTYAECIDYLAAVAEDPEHVPLPTERFTEDVLEFGGTPLPLDAADLPDDLTPEDFTGLECFGLAFLKEDIQRGILKMRLARDEA
jgi:hypothetical protein